VLAAAVLLLPGCVREQKPGPYVARVDQSYLTEDELAASRDSTGDIRQGNREFIGNWVTTELLYQEAARRHLADTPELRRQIENTRKHLAIAALLEAEVYGADSGAVTEDAIASLYNAGGEAFRLREDVMNLSFALFGDRDAANTFRSRVLGGIQWESAIQQIQRDSLLTGQLIQVAGRQYFTHSILYPEELWKLAHTLSPGDISFVLKTDAGYYVVMAHGMRKQGEMPELNYIRNEIRERLLIEQRRIAYEKFLARLRSQHTVEVRTDPGDTTAPVTE
jgi:hypothetical protein